MQVTHERVEVTADVPDDEETARIVSTFAQKQDRMLKEEAGPVATALDGRFKASHLLFQQ